MSNSICHPQGDLVSIRITRLCHMGDCQNYGPFLGPYENTGPNTGPNLGDPKRDHNFDNPHIMTSVILRFQPTC